MELFDPERDTSVGFTSFNLGRGGLLSFRQLNPATEHLVGIYSANTVSHKASNAVLPIPIRRNALLPSSSSKSVFKRGGMFAAISVTQAWHNDSLTDGEPSRSLLKPTCVKQNLPFFFSGF